MRADYSTREAADLVGLTESIVRGCARAGFLSPQGSGVALRFSFRDLLVLRVVKALTGQGVPLRRIRRQLAELRRRLPSSGSLAEVPIGVQGGEVVVRDGRCSWRADTGQGVLDFGPAEPSAPIPPIQALPRRREAAAPEPVSSMTSDEWFERAVELEESEPEAAVEAYRRALHLHPDCPETLINLGRLLAETSDLAGAEQCFGEALRLDPGDATALYNLGVVAQDGGRDGEAIARYQAALAADATLAEAHYNLATLFDRTGDAHAAIRHINQYRKLTRNQT